MILCVSACVSVCVRDPGVLVKYSKIDLTPKAFSRSQAGREGPVFSLFLLTSSLPILSVTPHLPNLYLSVCIYYCSLILYFPAPFSLPLCFTACLSLFTFLQFCPSLPYIHRLHIAPIQGNRFTTDRRGNRRFIASPRAAFLFHVSPCLVTFVLFFLWVLASDTSCHTDIFYS